MIFSLLLIIQEDLMYIIIKYGLCFMANRDE